MIGGLSLVSFMRSTRKISRRALAAILVPQCACCRRTHQLPERLCTACLKSLKSDLCPRSLRLSVERAADRTNIETHYSASRAQRVAGISHLQSVFCYPDVVPDLLIRSKCNGMVELTDIIAYWVTHNCEVSYSYDLVTTIPCHWRLRLIRGFDHIWLLANTLAKQGLIQTPVKTLQYSKPLPFLHL